MFRDIAIQAFLMKYGDSENVTEFNCSAGLIDDFKERSRMSSRSVYYKRGPTVDPIEDKEWIILMADLVSVHRKCERVQNAMSLLGVSIRPG
jgi:hypothetical protein